jgi:hypothetical protein
MSSALPPTDAEREWHVLLSGERRGPYTQKALYDVLETHPAGWRSPVWRPGMRGWRPAREVAALLPNDETSTQAPRAAALFPDAGSDPALAMRPPSRGRGAPASAETTHDLPVYNAARPLWRRSVLAAVLGALVAVAALLLMRLQLAPAPHRAAAALKTAAPLAHESATASPPPLPVRAPPGVEVAPPEAAAQSDPSPPPVAASERPVSASRVKSVRVRARWAPVRASGDPEARVLCSLPRGAVVAVMAERPGTHARWFAVRCSGDIEGWVHENFLARR